jgi:ABC-type multidrug transport system permease subunit
MFLPSCSVLAGLLAAVGAILFRRNVIGRELTISDYLNPLFLVTIPRLIPFAASMLSIFFGLVYFGQQVHRFLYGLAQ